MSAGALAPHRDGAASDAAGTGRPGFAPAAVEVERALDGTLILRSPLAPREPARAIGVWLERWAERAPTRVFLQERGGPEPDAPWRAITYADAHAKVRSIGEALLDRKLSPERPVAILAENGIDHALVSLGAMGVGLVAAPISTAYARLSQDFAKLRYIVELLEPELIFLDDPARYGPALDALDWTGIEIVAGRPAPGRAFTALHDLLAATPTGAVQTAFAAVGPETTAKILFTSGSTDLPKGVVNTHRMLCSNQEGIAQLWPFVDEAEPILVDWLPWNHTFGGNFDFNLVLRNGGTLVIDEGRPVASLFGRSVANLKAIAPTLYLNVPRGFAFLLDELEADPAFNRHFFSRLELIFYAAAALPQNLWVRMERCSMAARGAIVPMVAAWGMTETSPMSTCVHFPIAKAGVIGLPGPGTDIRLAPVDGRFEIQVRGPNVTPGYWRRPDLTAGAFVEGWFRTGDAAKLEDPDDPAKGIVFDGRIAENFKLTSATWVNVGMVRVAVLAAAPMLADAVIAGHDRDEVTLLGFPNLPACRELCPELASDADATTVVGHPSVRTALADALARHNAKMPGNSTAIMRAILLAEPPSIDADEITDKGYINQRAVLTRRAALVEQLYAKPADAMVITVPARV